MMRKLAALLCAVFTLAFLPIPPAQAAGEICPALVGGGHASWAQWTSVNIKTDTRPGWDTRSYVHNTRFDGYDGGCPFNAELADYYLQSRWYNVWMDGSPFICARIEYRDSKNNNNGWVAYDMFWLEGGNC